MIKTKRLKPTYKMRKRFLNFKVSRVISSLKSCRSKHPSNLPSNPTRLTDDKKENEIVSLGGTNFRRVPNKKVTSNSKHRFSLKRRVASVLLSARRSVSKSNPRPSHETTHARSSSLFRWEKQPKWHVIAKITESYDSTPPRRKIYNSSASEDNNDVCFVPRKQKKRRHVPLLSASSDSGLSSDNSAGETDIDTYNHRCYVGRKSVSPARLSEFMRKMMTSTTEDEVMEGKVRESFAVVKRSEDPYNDFRRSMAEMVVEKEMFERKDMEELLRCFLSLNSEHLHGVIIRAFVDIWEALFCSSSISSLQQNG